MILVQMKTAMVLLLTFVFAAAQAHGAPAAKRLAPPVVRGQWLVPADGNASQPVWGIRGGIAVGLWPTPGPRGLLRIYAPYLGHPPLRMINYIAVEPVVGRRRGLSELEPSTRDGARGKAMWTADRMEPSPRTPRGSPAKGRIIRLADDTETLTFFVFVERFANGAEPVVQVTLRQDRPHEVALTVFAVEGSARMDACVLTATMGNYARLRHLWLKGKVVDATHLWPDTRPGAWGFMPHREWELRRLLTVDGEAVVAATPNEPRPNQPTYADGVPRHWRYRGKPATQYWRAPAQPGLVARVNGRAAYWNTRAAIPGGVSYENFELAAPFREGQTFIFGVTPEPPNRLGFRAANREEPAGGY
ncbi:MAG: hypothetical protein ISS72_00065 [Candidatus Brocadiae bacterium]|nr:hypothetical protein [Candidatus Brocadiia bacterium]